MVEKIDGLTLVAINLFLLILLAGAIRGFKVFYFAALAVTPLMLTGLIVPTFGLMMSD